jgi:hypothetical protein
MELSPLPLQIQSQDFAKLIDGGKIIKKSATNHAVIAQAFAATTRPLLALQLILVTYDIKI